MKLRFLASPIAIASFCLGLWLEAPAIAQARQRIEISSEAALNSIPKISVPSGNSVVLSLDNGEYIQAVWLDSPNAVGVATDRPLCPYEGRSNQGCGNAQAIRLMRIPPGGIVGIPGLSFNFQGRISTLMSVLTIDGRDTQIYQFQLVMEPTNVSLVSIVSPEPANFILAASHENSDGIYQIDAIRKGMQVAIEEGSADRSSAAWNRLENFIQMTGSGLGVGIAIRASSVDPRLLRALQDMGNSYEEVDS